MLRRISLAVVALASLAIATSAQAQVTASDRPKIGLGVMANTTAPFILVPLNVSPQLKIEPFAGINTEDFPSTSGNPDRSSFLIGSGVFVMQHAAPNLDLLLGGRLSLNFVSEKPQGGSSTSGTDVTIAAAVGAEYYLAPKFSVGAEGNLGFFSNSEVSGDNTGLFTTGFVLVRFYM